MTTRIVVDGSSDIPADFAAKNGIEVAYLSVSFDDTSIKQTPEFDLEGFYERYKKDEIHPKTSQPAPADFLTIFEKLVADGAKNIIVITISKGLSATINSARLAAETLNELEDDVTIHLVDSKSASYPSVFLAKHGLKMIAEGVDAAEIAETLRKYAYNIKTRIYVPTLKYLRRGGRISMAKFLLGTLLGKQVIIGTNIHGEGKNHVVATVTSKEQAYSELVEQTTENSMKMPERVSIIHSAVPDMVKELRVIMEKTMPDVDVEEAICGTIISAHTGPYTLAIISDFNPI